MWPDYGMTPWEVRGESRYSVAGASAGFNAFPADGVLRMKLAAVQEGVPVVGSVFGRSKLGKRFVEGWNRLDGTQIYISRGIGKVLVPVRLGCPPEIACLRLRRAPGKHPAQD